MARELATNFSLNPKEKPMFFLTHKLSALVGAVVVMIGLLASPAPGMAYQWLRTAHVLDGDTLILEDGRHLRFLGINAPEIPHKDKPGEMFGYDSKRFAKNIIASKKIRLEFDHERQDRYGRTLGYLFTEDGAFINEEMIRNGWAFYLPARRSLKHHSRLLAAQRLAMDSTLGIWRVWKEKTEPVAGNKRSKRFHLLSCSFGKKISRANRIDFTEPQSAFYSGYAPCRKCMGQ